MRVVHDRAARLHVEYPAHDLAAVLHGIRPQLLQRAEFLALVTLVCTFWGLLLYTAVETALS